MTREVLKTPCPKCGGRMMDYPEVENRIELTTHHGRYASANMYACERCGYIEWYNGDEEHDDVEEEIS